MIYILYAFIAWNPGSTTYEPRVFYTQEACQAHADLVKKIEKHHAYCVPAERGYTRIQ